MTTANNSSYVPFLKDADLEKEVRALLEKAKAIQNKLDDEKMHKNVIDPFGSLIEQAGFDIDYNEWFKNERTRQMQKSLANAIGEFHQKIIGHIDGWQDLGTGKVVDLVHEDKKIIAEVKNKHNTVTASKLMDVYDILEGQVMPKNGIYRGYTSYLVQIIPAAPERYDDTFTPSNTKTGTKKPQNDKIRRIDGYSFYALASGYPDAYRMIFATLPKVIKKCNPSAQISTSEINALFKRAYG